MTTDEYVEQLEQTIKSITATLINIATNKVINNPPCRTDKCKTSIGICFDCRLKQCNEMAELELSKLYNKEQSYGTK